MSVYFDHAAATRVLPEVAAAWPELLREYAANPESVHAEGRRMRAALENAAERIAAALLGRPCPAVWAASGSDALRLLAQLRFEPAGTARLGRSEHPATVAHFGGLGRAVAVVSLVQSETGQIFRDDWPDAGGVVIADAVQAAGKIPLRPGADFYVISGHKLGAPGGAAVLAATAAAQRYLEPFKELREHYHTGRPEVSTVMALALAAETMAANMERHLERITALNRMLREGFLRRGVRCTIPEAEASPYILHLMLPGYQGAVLARFFSRYGVCLSSGSACQAESDRPSPALLALGYGRKDAYSGLRLSFGVDSTAEEAGECLAVFDRVLAEY